jgi:hypothetical protein
MDNIIKDLHNLNETIYNFHINIGFKINEKNINKHIPEQLFERYENCFKKFCQFYINKKYISYHHNNLILNINNDINYVTEINIIKNYFVDINQKYVNLYVTKNQILDNIVFPNLEQYHNIIKHNDNIYKFVIKNINIPIYIHFDKHNYNNIFLETKLNIQQLNYGFDSIQYLLKFFK